MDDGVGGGDVGALSGVDAVPADGHCLVVDHPGSSGIHLNPDGGSYVVLPRPVPRSVPQPSRPEDGATDDPAVSA